MNTDTQQNKVAVFFDYENIVYSLRNRFETKANFEALIAKCKQHGQIVMASAFADWGLSYMSPALLYALQSSGFDLVFVPTGSTQANSPRKNVADLYMAIHVLEALFTRPDIDTFILLTGDRDFMPLVNVIKRNGKHVVAIGVDGSSSYYLTQAVDDFYYYSEVISTFEEAPRRIKGRPVNVYDALVQAVGTLEERGKTATLTQLKQVLIDMLDGFDERQYNDIDGKPIMKFKDFVMDAKRRGYVKVSTGGKRTEVFLSDKPLPKQSVEVPSAQISLQAAYKLLVQAVQQAEAEGKSFRSSSIKGRMARKHPGFDERMLRDGKGKTFQRFSDFAKSAAALDLVTIVGKGVKLEIRPVPVTEDSADEKGDSAAVRHAHDTASTDEKQTETVTIDNPRQGLLLALQAYNNYPTSFLSLANHCQRWCEKEGLALEDSAVRALLTEAVNLGLVQQSTREDGKRKQYALNDRKKLISAFMDSAPAETKDEEEAPTVVASDEVEVAADAKSEPAPPAIEEAFAALVEAVTSLAADGTETMFTHVKSRLIEKLDGFDEKSYLNVEGKPFSKFKEFVQAAEERELVTIVVDGTVNKVILPTVEAEESEPTPDETPEPEQSTPETQESAPDYTAYTRLSDEEERKLVLEALQAYDGYPAPFMTLLAHCRNVRDGRQVYLPNSPLRELLSDATKVGVLTSTTKKGERPTLYALVTDDEKAFKRYLGEEVEKEVIVAEESADSDTSAEVEPQAESEPTEIAPVEEKVEEPAPEPEVVAPTDIEIRQTMIDALASFAEYPNQFQQILDHCWSVARERELEVPNQRIRALLREAMRKKVLTITTMRGVRPILYAYVADDALNATYIGIEPEVAPSEAIEAPVEPSAETTASATELADANTLDTPSEPTEITSVETDVTSSEPVVEESDTAPESTDESSAETNVTPVEPVTEAQVPEATLEIDPFALLLAAVEALSAEGRSTVSSAVKRRMRRDTPDFDEKNYADADGKPFRRFKDFTLEAQRRGLIVLEKAGRQDRLLLPPTAIEPEVTEFAPPEDLAPAFDLLTTAIAQADEKNSSHRLSAIRHRMVKIDPSFNVKALTDAQGNPFKSLSAFVRTAEGAGLVELSGKGIGIEVNLKRNA